MLWGRSALGALVLLCQASVAGAEDPQIHLDWERGAGAESCVDDAQLRQAVEARLGRRVFSSAAGATLTLRGRVERRSPRKPWRAEVALTDIEGYSLGTRKLQVRQRRCQDLTAAIVLVVAMLVEAGAPADPEGGDVSALEAELEKLKAELDRREAALAAREAELEAREAALDAREGALQDDPWQVRLALGTSVGVDFLPDLGFSGELRVAFDAPFALNIELGLSGWFPKTIERQQGRATFLATGAELALCPRFGKIWEFTLSACAGAQLGWLRARSEDFAQNATLDRLYANIVASGRARFDVSDPLYSEVHVGFGVPLRRDGFFAQDGSRRVLLHRADPAYFIWGLALGLAL